MEEALPELPRPRNPAAALARVKVAPALLLCAKVRCSNMGKEHYFRFPVWRGRFGRDLC